MSTNWKPGDIALVTFDNATGNQRERGVERVETQRAMVVKHSSIAYPDSLWFAFDATSRVGVTWDAVLDARPLAVIDPEDETRVGELTDWTLSSLDGTTGRGRMRRAVTQALREIANPTPPKTDEPKGKYAEVEDERGWLYFRDPAGDWRLASNPSSPRQWSTVAAVRVLSEGVS